MPARIDQAFVEILPDFSTFARTATRGIDEAMDDVTRSTRDASRGLERQFQNATENVEEAFTEMSRSADQSMAVVDASALSSSRAVSRSYEVATEAAERDFDELALQSGQAMRRIDNDVTRTTAGMATKFKGAGLAAKAALLGAGLAAVTGLGAIIKMGLSSAASLEQTQISFNALLGGVEQGNKVFKQLQDFAAKTPFEFPEIADAGKRFLAFSGSVGLSRDQLLQYLTTIGNVISVTGGGAEAFGRINLAIGQIGSASKVTLDNLNQIADAIPGFSPIAAIAKGLGVTTQEAMKQISAGTLPAAQGVQLLLKGMAEFPGAAGAMEKQSQTLLGVFSTFKDVVGQTLAQAFQPAIPAIKDTLTQLTPIIGQSLGQIAPALGQVLVGALPLIGALVQGLTPILTPILNALGPALKELSPVIAPLGVAIASLITPLVPAIPAFTQFALILVQLLIPAIQLLGIVMKPIAPVLSFAAKAIGQFGAALRSINWNAVGNAIHDAFFTALHAVEDFFVGVGHFFEELPGMIGGFLKGLPMMLWNIFTFALGLAFQAIGLGIGLILFTVLKLPGLIFNALISLGPLLGNFFAGVWENMRVGAVDAFHNFINFLTGVPQMVGNAVFGVALAIKHGITDPFIKARNDAGHVVDNIVAFWHSIPERLGHLAQAIGNGIANFFKSFINGAIDSVNKGISIIDDITPGSLPRIPRLAHGGVAFGPSMIGENPGTAPEVAIPLGDARAVALIKNALGGGGPTQTVNFAPGAIVVNVNGSVTPEQAKVIGQQVGAGISSTLKATDIQTAVRMVG